MEQKYLLAELKGKLLIAQVSKASTQGWLSIVEQM